MRTLVLRSAMVGTFTAALLAAFVGCGQSSSGEVTTVSELATGVVSGAANSGSSGALAFQNYQMPGWWDRLDKMFNPVTTAFATNNTCPRPATGVAGLDCAVDSAGKIMTLTFNSCNFGNHSAVWEGSEILESNQTVECGKFPAETAGATLLRTFGEGTTRTIGDSVHVTSIDTSNPSGYETQVSGGTLITFSSDSSRTIAIRGIHLLSQKIFRGNGNAGRVETEADHTVSTLPEQPLTMTLNGDTRVVNGAVKVQYNDQKVTGTAVFKDVRYSTTSGCCLPVSGSVTTTFSGGKTGTETLEFAATECGAAKVGIAGGNLKDLTLTRCF